MLQIRKGCKVPFPEMLDEGYKVSDNQITANVSADKIEMMMAHFLCARSEPVFFILELPASEEDEAEIAPGILSASHKDVYYIDGCTTEEALAILNRIAGPAINDGMCTFGFGGHDSKDEITFGKYNVTTVFSRDIGKYKSFFEEHGIAENDHLVFAWDAFTKEHPGICEKVETNGKDVYSIPQQFAEWGIYKAEQREDS